MPTTEMPRRSPLLSRWQGQPPLRQRAPAARGEQVLPRTARSYRSRRCRSRVACSASRRPRRNPVAPPLARRCLPVPPLARRHGPLRTPPGTRAPSHVIGPIARVRPDDPPASAAPVRAAVAVLVAVDIGAALTRWLRARASNRRVSVLAEEFGNVELQEAAVPDVGHAMRALEILQRSSSPLRREASSSRCPACVDGINIQATDSVSTTYRCRRHAESETETGASACGAGDAVVERLATRRATTGLAAAHRRSGAVTSKGRRATRRPPVSLKRDSGC